MANKTIIAISLFLLVVGGYFIFFLKDELKSNSKGHEVSEISEEFEISPGDVARKISDNADFVLLDVRTVVEYEEVHLKNSLLLPVQQLSQQSLNDLGIDESMKDKEIILYCRSGARSKTAYNIMKSLGYTNIKSVAGGMIHWEEDKYPHTETGAYEGAIPAKEVPVGVIDGPRISLDRTSYDFGVIPQFGGVVKTNFTVQNNGTETLEIGQITTSCSCTTAEITSHSIFAGDKAILTVVFDPDFHDEPLDVFKRTVFIPTNDTRGTEAEVSIVVDIEEGK